MVKNRVWTMAAIAASSAALIALVMGPSFARADGDDDKPTPIGAWFGIARPCTPNDGTQASPFVDQEFCHVICGGNCPPMSPFFLSKEVTMIPTLLADGTVLADDYAEVGLAEAAYEHGDGHTTAQGKWALLGRQTVAGRRLDRYQASFIWFQGRAPGEPYTATPGGPGFFEGSARPRFTTFFDRHNPDVMKGAIQPYLYSYTDFNGRVIVDSAGHPVPDPIAPLPATCNPAAPPTPGTAYCFGTLQFTIRRIQAF